MRRIKPPYPLEIVPLLPEFLTRRRLKFTYPLRVLEELGIDRPTLLFVVNGVALQDDDGAPLEEIFNPYTTTFEQWSAAAAAARGAGLADLDERAGRWRITANGRELFTRVRREADSHLATLEPIPARQIADLAAQLARALAGIESSDIPKDHVRRNRRFRGDEKIPMVALENAVFGLWQARDDAHMASWRTAGFSGPAFDVLTRVWRREAQDPDELAKKLSAQRPADVDSALARLRSDGLVRSDTLEVTDQGGALRQRIEDETDRRFFAPWPDDVGAAAPTLAARLRSINAALAPA
jgi:DNA-binding MarR family transcriptional regulator